MKVILNYLPPGNLNYPSPSLSILQSFLNQHGHTTKTIHWNILMRRIMAYYSGSDGGVLTSLFPFFAAIANEYDDAKVKNKLKSYLQTLQPYYKSTENFYSNSLEEITCMVHEIFQSELSKDKNEALLFGISAKFYQWIPGIVLAKEIKKIYPNSKIVIGGLSGRDNAAAMMKKFHDFDYAIWGEGEYPLLDLCNFIEKKSVDPAAIPRLVMREGHEIKVSKKNKSEYLDFKNYIFPDLDDFFESIAEHNIPKDLVKIMLNTVNGCRWNKCSFCCYGENKVFRERTAENIFAEIRNCFEKNGVSNFYLADNDIVGKDVARFEKLLDLLIDYRKNENPQCKIFGEMIPSRMITDDMFRKMPQAGFSTIFIGYEAISEKLLVKMNKENSFSVNIYTVKTALKYNIKPGVNIIQGTPSETEEDIVDSIDNLHFLRFFFSADNNKLAHNYSTLNLCKGARYYKNMPVEERKNFDENPVRDYLPQTFIDFDERFDFFCFARNVLKNFKLWSDFVNIEKFYRKNKFTFEIIKNESSFVYKEFFNNTPIKNIEFENPVYLEILKEADCQIVTFDGLFRGLLDKHPEMTEVDLKKYLGELKKNYLVYYNEEFSEIISVINSEK